MGWRDWTGVGERRWKTAPNEQVQPSKTLWDWLQLLIVPAILIGATLLWNASQTERDSRREDRRIRAERAAAEQARQNATLSDYFQQMSDLMLNKKLLSSKQGDPVRSVARTVTLTTLRRLNGERKGEVVRFLNEARLIERSESLEESGTLVRLEGADLEFADLAFADLSFADFTNANLTDADLEGAFLGHALLGRATLTGADLTNANLGRADLSFADLTGAGLASANLTSANLSMADLTNAVLAVADLTSADLTDATLKGATLTIADLMGATLTGADLTNAKLNGANLIDADLTDATLKGADVDGAKGLPKRRR